MRWRSAGSTSTWPRSTPALDATEAHVGVGLVDLVVWHTTTGLPLAARGVDPVTAALWHQASRDMRAMLPYAGLPELGAYHLVGLADRRLAVLVHAGPTWAPA